MPITKDQRLANAKAILSNLSQENIQTFESAGERVVGKLAFLRDKIWAFIEREKLSPQALFTSTITTLLKASGCSELSQRFILEYCCLAKLPEAHLVILTNLANPKENHAIVLIGKPKIAPILIGNNKCSESMHKHFVLIQDFFKNQAPQTIIVDPLQNTFGDAAEPSIMAYCKLHGVTHVSGIVLFDNPGLIKICEKIKLIAPQLADQVNQLETLNFLNEGLTPLILPSISINQWKYHPQRQYFYFKGTEQEITLLYSRFKETFSTGEHGQLQIKASETSGAQYLIININSHQFDIGQLIHIEDHLPIIVTARHNPAILALLAATVPSPETSAAPSIAPH